MRILTLRFDEFDGHNRARFKTEGGGTVLVSKTVWTKELPGINISKAHVVLIAGSAETKPGSQRTKPQKGGDD